MQRANNTNTCNKHFSRLTFSWQKSSVPSLLARHCTMLCTGEFPSRGPVRREVEALPAGVVPKCTVCTEVFKFLAGSNANLLTLSRAYSKVVCNKCEYTLKCIKVLLQKYTLLDLELTLYQHTCMKLYFSLSPPMFLTQDKGSSSLSIAARYPRTKELACPPG